MMLWSLFLLFTIASSMKHFVLDDKNFVSLVGPITSSSVDAIIWEWNDPLMKQSMKKTNHTFLYLNSPGGFVQAGSQLMQYMRSLQHENITIDCIAQNFMSMAFIIFQSCNHRYILADSIGMQHQMSFGVQGSVETIRNQFQLHDQINNQWIQFQIDRIGISRNQYMDLITNDWWIYGEDNLVQNTADEIILYSCHSNIHGLWLTRQEIMSNQLFFLQYLKCPLYKHVKSSNKHFHDYFFFNMYPQKAKDWYESIFRQWFPNTL